MFGRLREATDLQPPSTPGGQSQPTFRPPWEQRRRTSLAAGGLSHGLGGASFLHHCSVASSDQKNTSNT